MPKPIQFLDTQHLPLEAMSTRLGGLPAEGLAMAQERAIEIDGEVQLTHNDAVLRVRKDTDIALLEAELKAHRHHLGPVAGATLFTAVNTLRDLCFTRSREAGWHDAPREVGTMLCLIHSEISEAMEGHRKGLMDDHLPERQMIEVELADAIIRIGDLAGSLGLDLGGAIRDKLEYNLHRQDHKRETRALAGGKTF